MKYRSLEVLHRHNKNSFKLDSHFHNRYEIIHIISGRIRIEISGNTYNVLGNSLVFISKLESHNVDVLRYPYERNFILIEPDYLYKTLNDPVLMSIFKQRPEQFSHVIPLKKDESSHTHSIVKTMKDEIESKADFNKLTAGAYFQILMANLYRKHEKSFPASPMTDTIKTVINIQHHIDNHFTENISLKKTAEIYHLDMYYLSHLFKKHTGYSFKEYIILQRINMARDILYNTNMSITQTSLKCGFNNVNHFIRIFKKYEGLTPLKYRKSKRS